MDGDRAPDPVASPPLPYPAAPNVSAPRLMPIQRPDEFLPDPAQDSRRGLAVLVAAVAVLALVAVLVWWTSDDGSAGGGSVGMGDAPAGVGGIGSAPTGEPSPGPQGGAPGAAGGPGVGPGGSAAPGAPPPTGGQPTAPTQTGASLLATYVIVPGLLWDQMTITITNSGDRDGKWSSMTVTFDGVNLVIVPGEGVSYEFRGGVHTFTPHASLQTVPPGSSVSFDFTTTVGGVLGDPTGCSLDGQECKG